MTILFGVKTPNPLYCHQNLYHRRRHDQRSTTLILHLPQQFTHEISQNSCTWQHGPSFKIASPSFLPSLPPHFIPPSPDATIQQITNISHPQQIKTNSYRTTNNYAKHNTHKTLIHTYLYYTHIFGRNGPQTNGWMICMKPNDWEARDRSTVKVIKVRRLNPSRQKLKQALYFETQSTFWRNIISYRTNLSAIISYLDRLILVVLWGYLWDSLEGWVLCAASGGLWWDLAMVSPTFSSVFWYISFLDAFLGTGMGLQGNDYV